MQLISRISDNATVRRLAVAVIVAMLALATLGVGRVLTSSSGERDITAGVRRGGRVLAYIPSDSGSGSKPKGSTCCGYSRY